MELNYITIMTERFEETKVFYRDILGWSIKREFDIQGGRIMFLQDKAHGPMIEFVNIIGVKGVEADGLVISFKSEKDLNLLRQDFEKAGYFPGDLINNPPKPIHFTVKDPNGIRLEFS